MASLGASSCGSAPELKWSAKPYVGDSVTQSIVRKNGNQIETISCDQKEFNTRVCYDIDEVLALQQEVYRIVNLCEQWKE